MTWHATDDLVTLYANGDLDRANAASLEAHLLSCSQCRTLVADVAPRDRLDRVWTEVRAAADEPRRRPMERVLVWLGVPDHYARLLAATPSLQASWFVALVGTSVFAVASAQVSVQGVIGFLAVAPLAPLAGVVLAYGPRVDPIYDVEVAAPMRSSTLLMARAIAVFVASILVLGVASLALPSGLGLKAAAWLLPSLALVTVSLAASTWFDPLWSAGTVAAAWLAVIIGSAQGSGDVLSRIRTFQPAGQIVLVVVVAIAAAVFALRSTHIDQGASR